MSKTFTLNIGLAPSKHSGLTGLLDEASIRKALEFNLLHVLRYEVQQSATEATAVVQVEDLAQGILTSYAVYDAAQRLHQDCIAVVNDSMGIGALVGPRADEWGVFDPAYFLNFAANDNAVTAQASAA